MKKLDFETASRLVEYDKETGMFRRISRCRGVSLSRGWFKGYMQKDGYFLLDVGGNRIMAHRLAILLSKGVMPSGDVDHINFDRGDNRLINLRVCSKSENNRWHQKPAGPSGFTGVRFNAGKFEARIKVNQKKIYIGRFETAELAALARDMAAIELHGEFAKLNFPK